MHTESSGLGLLLYHGVQRDVGEKNVIFNYENRTWNYDVRVLIRGETDYAPWDAEARW
jgi:hypothetical protein